MALAGTGPGRSLVRRRLQPAPANSSGIRIKVNESDRMHGLLAGVFVAGSVPTLLDVHQATVERGAAADIGEPIGGEHIDVAMIGRTVCSSAPMAPEPRPAAPRRSTLATNVQLPRWLKTRTRSPFPIPRARASSSCRNKVAVCRSAESSLPKVEFILSWLLAEISSSGKRARNSGAPSRDSMGG